MGGPSRVALAAAALALAVLVAAYLARGRLVDAIVFQPMGNGSELTLDGLGVPGEELDLETEDGVSVHAYFLPAGPDHGAQGGGPLGGGARVEGARAADRALLFLHGNAGNASHRLPNAAALAALGTDVLLLDYRGYGKSGGAPSESGVYADARAALAHLGARGYAPRRIVLFGRSLGGAVAVELARGRPLAGVILESTFTSAADLGRTLIGPLAAPLVGDRFASDAKIVEVRAPLLFFHGDRDRVIPLALGRRLHALAPEPKALEILRGAGHNDTVRVGGRAYLDRIRRFLDEVAPPALRASRGSPPAP